MKIEGARALVTGAGVRVGRAIALGLARRGAHVAVHYFHSSAEARATAREVEALGVKSALLEADLSDAAQAEGLARRAKDALGGLEIVINSAAIMERRPLAEVTPADWDRVMHLNLRGPFFVAKGAAAACAPGGAIVNIADLAAFEHWSGYPAHVISKAGVVSMTEVLAKALAGGPGGPGLRVNAVAPGAVMLPDDMSVADREHLARTTPLGRIGSPEDVVDAVIYLLQQDFTTGHTLVVDGGRRIR